MRYFLRIIQRIKRRWLLPVVAFICKICKINPYKIVVDNFGGRGYGDNPKYIVDELLADSRVTLDIVWLVNDMDEAVPEGVRKVKYNSVRAIYEYATARIWIDNIKNTIKPHKKSNQYYLQTWHGGIGLKKVERQIEDQLSPRYVNMAKKDAAQTDLMLSDSNWTTDIFHNWFWYDGSIAEVGFPRNDVLVNKPQEIITKVYQHFSLKKEQKIVLYAPTFRSKGDLAPYTFDYAKVLNLLQDRFGAQYVFFLRLHPLVKLSPQTSIARKIDNVQIFNTNSYNDVQELLLAADVIITDFSSLMFDAMIAEKKVMLFASDFDEYIASQRSILFNLEELPFPISKNITELYQQINSFNCEQYFAELDQFRDQLGLKEEENAAKKVREIIVNEILKG